MTDFNEAESKVPDVAKLVSKIGRAADKAENEEELKIAVEQLFQPIEKHSTSNGSMRSVAK